MIAGGLLLLVASLLTGEWGSFQLLKVSLLSLVSFIYLVVFGAMIAYSAYDWLLTKTSTTKVSTYSYVNPVVAILLGYFLGGRTADSTNSCGFSDNSPRSCRHNDLQIQKSCIIKR